VLAQQSGGDDDKRYGTATWAEAKAMCEKPGARMCTAAELVGHETAGTGCSHDEHAIWSSTPCANGFLVAKGIGGEKAVCLPAKFGYDVRCCADRYDAKTVVKIDSGIGGALDLSKIKLLTKLSAFSAATTAAPPVVVDVSAIDSLASALSATNIVTCDAAFGPFTPCAPIDQPDGAWRQCRLRPPDDQCAEHEECIACDGPPPPDVPLPNKCVCANGVAAEGAECDSDGATACVACGAAFHLGSSRACEANVCACPGGVAATGIECPVNGETACAACNTGFHEQGDGCAAHTVCGSGTEYETVAPSETQNRRCAELTDCDLSTQYQKATATPKSDRICAALTVCNATEYEASRGLLDRTCAALRECAAGTEYESKAPSTDSNRECKLITTCKAVGVEYLASEPTLTSDRVCAPVEACDYTTHYMWRAATASSNMLCAKLARCSSRSYESTPATQTSNRVCTAHKRCAGVTHHETEAATRTTDRKCGAGTVSCSELHAVRPDLPSGVYEINPNGTPTKVYCDMEAEGGGWSLVYRIAGTSTMQTTAAQNVVALRLGNVSDTGSGKLADTDIRAMCGGQYKVVQGAADGQRTPTSPLFCKYDNIETFGDDVWNSANKKCSLVYSNDTSAYTQSPTERSWNYGFSTWGSMLGGTILQLRYGDMRAGNEQHNAAPRSGPHSAQVDTAAGQTNVCHSGKDCHSLVWCKAESFFSCADLKRKHPATPSGAYLIEVGGTPTRLWCDMEAEGGGWSLVYSIADGATMQTTAAQNVEALQHAGPKAAQTGKLADSDMRTLCAGQYKIVQGAADGRIAPNMPLYCRYDNINTYGDDVWNSANKKCSLTYSNNASAYTQSPTEQSWNYGFSTWGSMLGGTILQLRYGDMRAGNEHNAAPRSGSHAASYDRVGGQLNICGTGTCRAQVWCHAPAPAALPISCAALQATRPGARPGQYRINVAGKPTVVYCAMPALPAPTTAAPTPAPCEPLLLLENGWVSYGQSWKKPTYSKSTSGVVVVEGLIKGGNYGTLGTLPAGFRPSKTLIFFTSTQSGDKARIDVSSNGKIAWSRGSGVTEGSKARGWVSLSGIIFSTSSTLALPLDGDWKSYGGSWGTATYSKSAAGVVIVEGLIRHGAWGTLAKLPEGFRPSKTLLFNAIVGSGAANSARVDVYADGTIKWRSGKQNDWISLSGITFSTTEGSPLPLATTDWKSYGGSYGTATFHKMGDMVVVEGLLLKADAGAAYGHFATLPAGSRPEKNLIFNLDNNGNPSRIDVSTSGTIKWISGSASGSFMSLSGIAFSTVSACASAPPTTAPPVPAPGTPKWMITSVSEEVQMGTFPYLYGGGPANTQPTAAACEQQCLQDPACKYGTYVTQGSEASEAIHSFSSVVRYGECWLAAETHAKPIKCGVACHSFKKEPWQPPAGKRWIQDPWPAQTGTWVDARTTRAPTPQPVHTYTKTPCNCDPGTDPSLFTLCHLDPFGSFIRVRHLQPRFHTVPMVGGEQHRCMVVGPTKKCECCDCRDNGSLYGLHEIGFGVHTAAAPYLLGGGGNNVVQSFADCMAMCKSEPQCIAGTFITEGGNRGECWISAHVEKAAHCDKPCHSFVRPPHLRTAAPTTSPEAPDGPCVCGAYYLPVKCANGQTYTNACHANCDKAQGCDEQFFKK
jgi:hypothetical protein